MSKLELRYMAFTLRFENTVDFARSSSNSMLRLEASASTAIDLQVALRDQNGVLTSTSTSEFVVRLELGMNEISINFATEIAESESVSGSEIREIVFYPYNISDTDDNWFQVVSDISILQVTQMLEIPLSLLPGDAWPLPSWSGEVDRSTGRYELTNTTRSPCVYAHSCNESTAGGSAIGTFDCRCIEGWEGLTCSEDINECASLPCQNGGVCSDSTTATMSLDQYACNCTAKWMGDNCAEDFNECASSPCSNGECQSHSTDFHCGYDVTSPNDVEIAHQSTTDCIGGQCTAERCCVITTCANIDQAGSAFDCSGKCGGDCTALIVHPSGVECTGGMCSATDCCTAATADMCDSFECTGDYVSHTNASTTACVGAVCTAETCCVMPNCADTDQAGAAFDCSGEADSVDLSNPAGTACVGGSCTSEVCCFTPSCTNSIAQTGVSFDCATNDNSATDIIVASPETAMCDGGECDVSKCCVEPTTDMCDSFDCATQITTVDDVKLNRPDAATVPCAGAACDALTCCIVPQCGNVAFSIDSYQCSCAGGWEGSNCNEDIEECLSDPCRNEAECRDSVADPGGVDYDAYNCTCTAGWAGHNCEDDINECTAAPCAEAHVDRCWESTTNDTIAKGAFVCTCLAGAFGVLCEQDINECANAELGCQNGGTCVDSHNSTADNPIGLTAIKCTCVDGWRGEVCTEGPYGAGVEVVIAQTRTSFRPDAFEAQIAAKLSLSSELLEVVTYQPYEHDGSRTKVTVRLSNSVDSRAVVVSTLNQSDSSVANMSVFIIRAWDIHESRCGSNSEDPASAQCIASSIIECDSVTGCSILELPDPELELCATVGSPSCGHDSSCVGHALGLSSCACEPGWTGELCNVDHNECAESPCYNGAVCTDSNDDADIPINVYNCSCAGGWEGHNCEDDLDECHSGPCQHGGLCFHSMDNSSFHGEIAIDVFRCNCTEGWTGGDCNEDVDECESSPCQNGGTCSESSTANVSVGTYECVCPVGVHSVEGICDADIDECLANPCDDVGSIQCFDSSNRPCQAFLDSDSPCPIAPDEPAYGDYWCMCEDGYSGKNCDDDRGLYDPCQPWYIGVVHSCSQNATCEYEGTPHSHGCACAFGFEGSASNTSNNCTDIDECLDQSLRTSTSASGSGPCNEHNTVRCIESYTSSSVAGGYFNCTCENGWGGEICDHDIDECAEQPCENLERSRTLNGTCEASYLDMDCMAEDGSSVADCEQMFWINVGQYQCHCATGFSGTNCDVDFDECGRGRSSASADSNPCFNANHNVSDPASCIDSTDDSTVLGDAYLCRCPVGWQGGACEMDTNECRSNPCRSGNHGGSTCHESSNGGAAPYDAVPFGQYVCECETGWSGYNCDVDTNECAESGTAACAGDHSECQESNTHPAVAVGAFACACTAGWDGGDEAALGRTSFAACNDDLNECLPSPCRHSSECTESNTNESIAPRGPLFITSRYVCDCSASVGWAGVDCDDDIDECEAHPCYNGATCLDSNDSSTVALTAFQCVCPAGYEGTLCRVDLNECVAQPCAYGGVCHDSTTWENVSIGEFHCRCPAGRGATDCSSDYDECSSVPCENGSNCTDSNNNTDIQLDSFLCDCTAGYTGTTCDVDVDECTSSPCAHETSKCYDSTTNRSVVDIVGIDLVGIDAFYCECATGWEGSRCLADIDDCMSTPCNGAGDCTDSLNAFECDCEVGYEGDRCQFSRDPCIVDVPAPCADFNNSLCVHTGPSLFRCDCATGYNVTDTTGEGSSGSATGVSFVAFDFSNGGVDASHNEDLIVHVDGVPQTITLTIAITSAADAVTALAGLSGAAASVDGANVAITSSSTGTESTVAIVAVGSGTAALALFGTAVIRGPGTWNPVCEDFDECLATPCQHDGLCVESNDNATIPPGNYSCVCADGFTGTNCGEDIDECASAPCHNGLCFESQAASDVADRCSGAHAYQLCAYIMQSVVYRHTAYSNACVNATDNCTVVNPGSHVCLCPGGFTGDNCEIDIDECASTPCSNGAACYESNGSTIPNATRQYWSTIGATNISGLVDWDEYRCVCVPGSSGPSCVEDRDECASAPCLNGAFCTESNTSTAIALGAYNCNCTAGWSGTNCAIDIDECASVPCANSGNCSDAIDAFECACIPGFNGSTCELNILECASSPCLNGGNCSDAVDAYTCNCTGGWDGDVCEQDVNECQLSPCVNGRCFESDLARWSELPFLLSEFTERSIINRTIGTFDCTVGRLLRYADAAAEFYDSQGPFGAHESWNCSIPIAVGDYYCSCAPGWDDAECDTDIDECLSSPCQNNATCADGVDLFECFCEAGWGGNVCDLDLDECVSQPCAHNATCSDLTDIDDYDCDCTAGWQGDNCELDFDECHSSPCQHRGACNASSPTVVTDVFECACVPGWEGNRCEIDRDECLSSPCMNGGTCLESNNEECRSSGSWSPSETDDDPSDLCLIDSYVCHCALGFVGEQCAEDVDECASDPCRNGAVCSDSTGNATIAFNEFSCACPKGWTGDTCAADVDECESSPCSDAVCVDSSHQPDEHAGWNIPDGHYTGWNNTVPIGEYLCNCTNPVGMTGNNCEVDLDECWSSPCLHNSTCLESNSVDCRSEGSSSSHDPSDHCWLN